MAEGDMRPQGSPPVQKRSWLYYELLGLLFVGLANLAGYLWGRHLCAVECSRTGLTVISAWSPFGRGQENLLRCTCSNNSIADLPYHEFRVVAGCFVVLAFSWALIELRLKRRGTKATGRM
jgi:hypothetical protein